MNFSEIEKYCKHCKKIVKTSLDCEICNSSFHRSCAFQAKVADKNEKVICCKQTKQSEVTAQASSSRGSSTPIMDKIDEKTLKSVIKNTLVELINPYLKRIWRKA